VHQVRSRERPPGATSPEISPLMEISSTEITVGAARRTLSRREPTKSVQQGGRGRPFDPMKFGLRMKTKFLVGGLGLVIAGGTGVAWRERAHAADATRARTEIEHRAAEWRAERANLEERLRSAGETKAEREAELARLGAEKSAGQPASAFSNKPAAADAKPRSPKRADVWERSIRTDPGLQALRVAADRARRTIEYASFFRERGLTPEQVTRFQEIAMARDEAMADIGAAVQSQGLTEDDPSVERLRSAANAEFKSAQTALLGADGLERLREFETTLSSRSAVRGLAAVALGAGLPLSPQQAEQLAEVLAENRARAISSDSKLSDWNAVDERARTFLSPEQLALLQRIEPSAHGAGGRHWRKLGESIQAARQHERSTGGR
jgi:hypothetical protein